MNSCSITDNILSRHPLLELLYSPIISAIGNVVDFMVGTFELDFILRFLAMAELKRASFCSFGLPKTFVGIALGLAASLVEEPAQGAYQPEMMKKTAMRISLVSMGSRRPLCRHYPIHNCKFQTNVREISLLSGMIYIILQSKW